MVVEQTRIVISGVAPQIDNGRYPLKRVVGDSLTVVADIFKDGHELLKAAVIWRPLRNSAMQAFRSWGITPSVDRHEWRESELTEDVNDRWQGELQFDALGPWVYCVVAWTDRFRTWRDELKKKSAAAQDVSSELLEGIRLMRGHAEHAHGRDREDIEAYASAIASNPEQAHQIELGLHPRLAELMARNDPREDLTCYAHEIPVWVDRERARYGAWYEIFVRSQGTQAQPRATFVDAETRLPAIAEMGFDVLYLTPIHPIGETNRKGANNSEVAKPGEPGSPWAIGSRFGGHDAIHPELGTLRDFDHFVVAAKGHGLEIALDFAVQCAPDHPWVKQHPQWFNQRPDGSIKYAENPPKKYQDIYPINFDSNDRDGLYNALLDVVEFWIAHGVSIFRVDNPHTKPASFWEWLITTIHKSHPEIVFLAEAFTRPKRMHNLAKLGFSQSYTYFTWRNQRQELEDYAHELFCSDVKYFFRPNFFANTPDILHAFLQHGGKAAFEIRLILAATLSASYGIYSGYELCENTALKPESEEYLDSEKYQVVVRDWHQEGNIVALITRINEIRKNFSALHELENYQRLDSTCAEIMAFAKTSDEADGTLVVVVNLDPHNVHDGMICMPGEFYAGQDHEKYKVEDLLSGEHYQWQGAWNYVRLDPTSATAHILHLKTHTE